MKNFQYYTPTKVVFGKDTQSKVGELVKEQGAAKVLIHYGGGSAVRSGLIDQVKASLDEAGIAYVELGGVKPNPRLALAKKGIELCKKEGVDFILAVGGGSAIDSAKCIAYGLANEGDVWDFFIKTRAPKACAPVGAVLTIAAAGSEMSNSCVITNEDVMLKRGVNTDLCRCRFAVMNPELTCTLPDYQTACGCLDIMMHIMERYFSTTPDTMLVDGMSEAVLRTVKTNALILHENPTDYDARAQVMWASSLAHNGLLGCGRDEDWATHQLGHEISGKFDVAHGAGLAAIWGSWARYVIDEKPERFAQFAHHVFDIPVGNTDPKRTGLLGIRAMEDFIKSIGLPVKVSGLGIDLTDEQIREMAHKCADRPGGKIGGFKKLGEEDMLKIFEMAR